MKAHLVLMKKRHDQLSKNFSQLGFVMIFKRMNEFAGRAFVGKGRPRGVKDDGMALTCGTNAGVRDIFQAS